MLIARVDKLRHSYKIKKKQKPLSSFIDSIKIKSEKWNIKKKTQILVSYKIFS